MNKSLFALVFFLAVNSYGQSYSFRFYNFSGNNINWRIQQSTGENFTSADSANNGSIQVVRTHATINRLITLRNPSTLPSGIVHYNGSYTSNLTFVVWGNGTVSQTNQDLGGNQTLQQLEEFFTPPPQEFEIGFDVNGEDFKNAILETWLVPSNGTVGTPQLFQISEYDENGNLISGSVFLPPAPEGWSYATRLKQISVPHAEPEQSNLTWNIPLDKEIGPVPNPTPGQNPAPQPVNFAASTEFVQRVGDSGVAIVRVQGSSPAFTVSRIVNYNTATGQSSQVEVKTPTGTTAEAVNANRDSNTDLNKFMGEAQPFPMDEEPLEQVEEAIQQHTTAREDFYQALDDVQSSLSNLQENLSLPSLAVGSTTPEIQFGQTTIELSLPSWIRSLFKLALVIIAFFAARSMVANTFA